MLACCRKFLSTCRVTLHNIKQPLAMSVSSHQVLQTKKLMREPDASGLSSFSSCRVIHWTTSAAETTEMVVIRRWPTTPSAREKSTT